MTCLARPSALCPVVFALAAAGCTPTAGQLAPPPAAPPAPTVPVSAAATRDYWTSLDRITRQQGEHLRLLSEAVGPQRMATVLKDAGLEYRKYGEQVAGLPVAAADEEAVKFAALTAEVLQETASLYCDFSEFLVEVNDYTDRSKTWCAGLTACARIYLGDPLGPFNDVNEKTKQFDARRRKLGERFTALEEKKTKLTAAEMTTRSALARRHGGEFPTIVGRDVPPVPTYQVIVGRIAVKRKKATGADWDGFPFTAPEPFVKLHNVNRGNGVTTEYKKDTYTATFDAAGPLVSPGDKLTIAAIDKDIEFDDPIGEVVRVVTESELASGSLTLSFGQVESLTLRFVKK